MEKRLQQLLELLGPWSPEELSDGYPTTKAIVARRDYQGRELVTLILKRRNFDLGLCPQCGVALPDDNRDFDHKLCVDCEITDSLTVADYLEAYAPWLNRSKWGPNLNYLNTLQASSPRGMQHCQIIDLAADLYTTVLEVNPDNAKYARASLDKLIRVHFVSIYLT